MKKINTILVFLFVATVFAVNAGNDIIFINAHTLNITPSSAVAVGASAPTDKWYHRFGVSTGSLDGNYIEWQKTNGAAPDISLVAPGLLDASKAYDIYLYYVSPSTQNWRIKAKLSSEESYKVYHRSTAGAELINDNNGNLNHNRLYRILLGTVIGTTDVVVDIADRFTAEDAVMRCVFDGVGYKESVSTSIKNINNDNAITLFPNPASSYLQIKQNNEYLSNSSIEIYSLNGVRYHCDFTTNSGAIFVDINKLPKGLFVLKIINEKGIFAKKFSK